MPQNPNRLYAPSVRKRIAYFTAFKVFISYAWLRLKSKILGKKYYNKHIKALHLKNADRVKDRVGELQGLFIKFGQLLSNLSNVLPNEFRAPLEELQDHNQERPYQEIENTILEQFGKKPDEIFDNFNKKPLAAASIGQVHTAELEGVKVVVKVQHHNIDVIAQADLEILKNLVKIHGYFMDMQGLEHTYEQVRQMIEEELDYTMEASSMQTVAKNLSEVPELRVVVPKVYPDYSSPKVLVSTFCKGVNIGHTAELLKWNLDLEDLAKRLIELYCKMILVDGFYHADPHPGNILANEEGELILLDFGAVAKLDESTKKAIPELIEAVIKNDTEETVLALRKLGFLGSEKESKKYVEKIIDIFKEFIKEEVELDGLNFQNVKLNSGLSSVTSLISKIDLREVSNNINIPKDYILLNRTIVLLMGNAFQLAPKLNSLDVIRPYMKKHILDHDQGFSQMIVNTFKNQITTAISLPNELSKFLKTANDQDVETDLKEVKIGLNKLYYLGQQFLYSLVLIALVYFLNQFNLDGNNFMRILNYGLIAFFGLLLFKAIVKDFKT